MNRNYFLYQIRSGKLALAFAAIMYVLLCFTPFLSGAEGEGAVHAGLYFGIFMSIALTYVLPVLQFGFVQSRRRSDQVLSLPVSRKELLLTSMASAFLMSFGLWLVSALLLYVLHGTPFLTPLQLTEIIVYGGLVIAEMLCINLAFFLTADNLFDGIVMITAYSLMPVLILMVTNSFLGMMVAGSYGFQIPIAGWLSPVYMNYSNLNELLAGNILQGRTVDFQMTYFILPLVYAVLAVISLRWLFLKRKSERADQLSGGKAAYPLVITIYAASLLIILSFMTVSEGSVSGVILYYLILLLACVVAEFVYRRSISLRPGVLIRFACGTVAALLFSVAAWETQAFSISGSYTLGDEGYLVYSYSTEYENKEDRDNPYWVSFSLRIPMDRISHYEQPVEIMEACRRDAIDAFYERTDGRALPASMSVWNEQRVTEEDGRYGVRDYNGTYFYSCRKLSLAQLETISSYTSVMISGIDDEGNWNDGTLRTWIDEGLTDHVSGLE